MTYTDIEGLDRARRDKEAAEIMLRLKDKAWNELRRDLTELRQLWEAEASLGQSRALWREITRREWACHRCDQRQDNGNSYEMLWYEGMMAGLAADTPAALAAGVEQHRTLAGLVSARRRGVGE